MKFYDSIDDMPIYNWFKCIEKQDYKYTLIEGEVEPELCKNQFDILYSQFIDEFGINDNLREIIRVQNKILVHKINMALTGDKGLLTFIEIDELELKNLLADNGVKTGSTTIMIEKEMGFAINEHQTSVTKYYTYLKEIKANAGR